ncbi:MAG: phosphate acyltransferase [Clostridia bacterium]|nr:phosphate acyltransferase [Clostridia bacterium]
MADTYKIVIDTKGSDKGSSEIVKGAALALEKNEGLSLLIVGDGEYLRAECERLGMPQDRVEILDAPEEVTNYDDPSVAVFKKTDSSMMRSLMTLSERADLYGMITAGNTGALIAGSVRYLSAKERVRPCLSAVLPASDGSFTCLVDTGATIDCTPSMLLHFARLGSDLMRRMYGIESPRVGLLSNGSEPTKGNKLVKEAHPMLAEAEDINFVGNIEGNAALSGACDVLVCDGFAGNQVLKVSEGMATRLMTDIVKYAKRTGSDEVMKLVGHLMGVYDFSSLGGGIILGCKKPVIKTRGSSGADAVANTARMLLNMAENKAVFDKEKNRI